MFMLCASAETSARYTTMGWYKRNEFVHQQVLAAIHQTTNT